MSHLEPDLNTTTVQSLANESSIYAPAADRKVIIPNTYLYPNEEQRHVFHVPVQLIPEPGMRPEVDIASIAAMKGRYKFVDGEEPLLDDPGYKYQYVFKTPGYKDYKVQYRAKTSNGSVPITVNQAIDVTAKFYTRMFEEGGPFPDGRAAQWPIGQRYASGIQLKDLYLVELQIIDMTIRPVIAYLPPTSA